eukprot:GHVS01085774.1.p1 GENE.GHVS01085774.1~~GHVS01085774.1.p1  ORF type:complete len:392 (+),score=46.08 GHVS01085774.1:39-1214(+)
MEDLFLHVFLIAPAIRWLIHKSRPWNKKSPVYGVCLAVAAFACIAAVQFHRDEQNLYELLGLPVTASRSEVQSTYRRLAVKYHPDKNPDPEAKEFFDKIRKAQEVLTNDNLRNTYTRFGDFKDVGDVNSSHFWDVLFVAAIQCLIPLFFGYLYTFGKDSQVARKVFLCYVGLAFCMELLMRFGHNTEYAFCWVPGLRAMLPFEKVKALQGLVPVVLNGVLLLGSSLHKDEEGLAEKVSTLTLQTNLELVERADSLVAQLNEREDLLAKKSKKPNAQEGGRLGNGVTADTGSAMGSDSSGEEEDDEWLQVVDTMANLDLYSNYTRFLPPPAGLRISEWVCSRSEARDSSWFSTRGKQLDAFITVRQATSTSTGGVTVATLVFFGLLFAKYFW